MTCDELRAFLETTLAEERTAERMGQLHEHARQCPACQAYLKEALDLERQLKELPSFTAGGAVMMNVMARVTGAAKAEREEANGSRIDFAWVAMLVLGLFFSVMPYLVTPGGGQWFKSLLTIRWQLAANPGNLFGQPWPVTVLSGLGASLAAVAIFWQASRTSQSQPRRRGAVAG